MLGDWPKRISNERMGATEQRGSPVAVQEGRTSVPTLPRAMVGGGIVGHGRATRKRRPVHARTRTRAAAEVWGDGV